MDLLLVAMNKLNTAFSLKFGVVNQLICDNENGLEPRLQMVQNQADDNTSKLTDMETICGGLKEDVHFFKRGCPMPGQPNHQP